MSSLLAVLLTACGPRPQPIIYLPRAHAPVDEAQTTTAEPSTATEAATAETTPKPAGPAPASETAARETAPKPAETAASSSWPDYEVPTLPMDLVLHRGTLVWADLAGAIWMMPADGSLPPKQVSEQHRDGFAAGPFVAGDRVIARCGKGLLAIEVPGGAVTQIPVTGVPDLLESAVGDSATIFFTIFNQGQVMRVPVTGGAAQHVVDVKRAVLALHGPMLYVASYSTGELLEIPTAGGGSRRIAGKLKYATALAVDDAAAYVYTENDRRLNRVELATGATKVLGEHLDNSDEVALAAEAIYTVSWPNELVRLPKLPGAGRATLADKLFQPRGVVHDEHFVYVTSDRPPRIVRVPAR